MSSETQKADLSSLRINRGAPESNGSGSTKKNFILYSSIGAVVLVAAAFFIFSGGMSSAEQIETATVSLTYRFVSILVRISGLAIRSATVQSRSLAIRSTSQ